MNRNEKKKLTWIDSWIKRYTKGAARRMKRSDKKRSNRFMRNYDKELCREESEEINNERPEQT